MLTGSNVGVVNVKGVSNMQAIRNQIITSVNNWCFKNASKPFAVRDLFGGANNNWKGTPIDELYSRQIKMCKSPRESHAQAAKDLGKIVKNVLEAEVRVFKVISGGRVLLYEPL